MAEFKILGARHRMMKTYVALFRGINVGGKNTLPMKELVAILEDLGAEGVRTYIQSGNAVFQHEPGRIRDLAARIAAEVEKTRDFAPRVLVLEASDVAAAAASNPFPEAESVPKSLHLFFLESPPISPDLDSLAAIRTPTERFHLSDRVFYLHAPAGIGRSKLAARVESALGVAATGRNWRTVGKILALTIRDEPPG